MAVGSLGGTRLVVTCLTLLWFGKLTRGADVLRPGIGKDFFGSGHYSVVNVARLHVGQEVGPVVATAWFTLLSNVRTL